MTVELLREQFRASIAALPPTKAEATPERLVAAMLRFQADYGQAELRRSLELEDDGHLEWLDTRVSFQRREVRRLMEGLGLNRTICGEAM